jgi:uncharacterized protein YoxC
MAEFNSCAKLLDESAYKEAEDLYESILAKGEDPYQTIMNMQNQLQDDLAKKLPKYNKSPYELKTMGDILDWVRKNEEAMRDEFRELYNAMGQMSKGEKAASSIWKNWKANHDEARNVKYADFSDSDKAELMFEAIDIVHFWTNIMNGLGFDAKEMFIMYALKQAENLKRYKNNY